VTTVVTLGRVGGGLVAVEVMVSEGCMLAFAFVDGVCGYGAEGYAWRDGDAAGHTQDADSPLALLLPSTGGASRLWIRDPLRGPCGLRG
jgi:hypothetical protein